MSKFHGAKFAFSDRKSYFAEATRFLKYYYELVITLSPR